MKEKQKRAVTYFQYPEVFMSEFSVLPRKISAYLRTDPSSDVNSRKIRDFYNILNINNLHFRRILSLCKKHHFVMRNGPFQGLKSTILHPKMGLIGMQNGYYQKAKRMIPDYDMGYIKRSYRPKWTLKH